MLRTGCLALLTPGHGRRNRWRRDDRSVLCVQAEIASLNIPTLHTSKHRLFQCFNSDFENDPKKAVLSLTVTTQCVLLPLHKCREIERSPKHQDGAIAPKSFDLSRWFAEKLPKSSCPPECKALGVGDYIQPKVSTNLVQNTVGGLRGKSPKIKLPRAFGASAKCFCWRLQQA